VRGRGCREAACSALVPRPYDAATGSPLLVQLPDCRQPVLLARLPTPRGVHIPSSCSCVLAHRRW
jgi:hypothetical protein